MFAENVFLIAPEGAQTTCMNTVMAGLWRKVFDLAAEESQLASRMDNLLVQAENHRTNLSALRCDEIGGIPDITAVWNITQGNYTGWLRLRQTGAALAGTLQWLNHGDSASIMSGTFAGGSIRFEVAYPGGTKGQYQGTVDASGKTMSGRTTGVLGNSPWSATRAQQP